MSKGRHAGQRQAARGFIIRAAGAAFLCAGIILVPFALDELFRYSPYGDPGAGTAGLWLGVAALVLIGVPVIAALAVLLARSVRRYLAWRRSLPAGERALVALGELALMTGLHVALSRHNREESARLTASVMGEERDGQ